MGSVLAEGVVPALYGSRSQGEGGSDVLVVVGGGGCRGAGEGD